jgi:hypothetical protein
MGWLRPARWDAAWAVDAILIGIIRMDSVLKFSNKAAAAGGHGMLVMSDVTDP